MKKITEYIQKITTKMSTETGIRLISVGFAIILFIAVSGGEFLWGDLFLTTKIIEDVPLTAEFKTETDTEYVVENLPETVDIKVTGTASSVEGAISQGDNISAEVDLPTNVTGEYEITASEIEVTSVPGVDLEVVNSTFSVSVQEKVVQSFPINLIFPNNTELEGGIILKDTTLSQESVTITGGMQTVSTIAYVTAHANLEDLPVDETGTATIEAPLTAYDASGKVVTQIEMDNPVIEVTQNYEYSTIEKPVRYEFVNNQTGLYIETVCTTENIQECTEHFQADIGYTEFVEVYGEESQIEELSEIVYQVNLADYVDENTALVATPVLPTNVYTLEQEQDVKVTLNEGETKKLDDVSIAVEGLKSNESVKTVDDKPAVVDVTITGAKEIINNIESSDLLLYVDVSECVTDETCTVPILYKTNEIITPKLEFDTIQVRVEETKEEN